MLRCAGFKYFLLLCLTSATACCFAQPVYGFTVTSTIEECTKGTASLSISGNDPQDSITVHWSEGTSNTFYLSDLVAGNYFVNVKIKHRKDTLINTKDSVIVMVKDTIISFRVGQEECVVSVGNYFSPNGDGYNDVLGVVHIEHYPDFELEIFDKWGQRIHHQRAVYKPWDGRSLGVNLPDGTYYYVFFYNASNRKHNLKGDVTILR